MAAPLAPILASDMYTPHVDDMSLDGPIEPPAKRQKLGTSVKAIDQALDGGLDYGSIHSITAEPDQDVKEVLQALLVSHLSSSEDASATVIDSTLCFDLLALYRALESSMKESSAEDQDAKRVLDRLKIMQVFDDIGLSEAVGELRQDLDRRPPVKQHIQPKKLPKSTIEDSDEEEEMLDDPSPKSQPPVVQQSKAEAVKQPAKKLLIIDNISKVISPLIKNNYANGQALLATLIRSLQHITKEHELCTVLVSNASNKPATEDEAGSLFGSCTIRPALAPTFGHLVHVQLYLHQIPARKVADAGKVAKAVEMVNLLEVVQDTIGMRYGRWAPFVCNPDGRLEDVS